MALSILKRPISCRLSDTANTTYSITNNGYGTAVLSGGSGLSNGQRVLIYNSLDSYNGFWYLSSAAAGFTLARYAGGPSLAFTQEDDNITIYPCLTDVKWSSVHLPILYRLKSTLWPINSEDSIRGIVGAHNDNGYVKITLSGAIDVNVLDWLFIDASTVDELDGPFHVLTKHSTTQYTINAPWSLATSPYTYSVATAQKYYNNYRANVRIYAGLQSGHLWNVLKPYELISTLDLVPETDNTVVVNINEIVKEKIEVLRNRPNYDSEPYDLDRFCEFYIEYAESYDSSNSLDVSTTTTAYTSDSVNAGWALDAAREFKSRYSGFMSDYVYADSDHLAKFLTLAERPVLFGGFYFDLSFINTLFDSAYQLEQIAYDKFGNESRKYTTPIVNSNINFHGNIEGYPEGVIRVLLTNINSDDSYQLVRITKPICILPANQWNKNLVIANFTTIGEDFFQSDFTSTSSVFRAIQPIYLDANDFVDVTIEVDVSGTNSGVNFTVTFEIRDHDGTRRFETLNIIANGAYQITLTDTSGSGSDATLHDYMAIQLSGSAAGTATVRITIPNGQVVSNKTDFAITEQKRIDVDQSCYSEYLYLTWKNALGGFDYWLFNAPLGKQHNINILQTQEKNRNIFKDWDERYGEFADSITQETKRESRQEFRVFSQNLTKDQVDYIARIKTSSLVQQMTSKYDRRTVIVDRNSFTVRQDGDQNHTIEFTVRFTNDIASQSL